VFIAVTAYERRFRATGNPELGLLFFLLPGAAASCLSPGRVCAAGGAMLAAPVCLLIMRLFFAAQRTFWQELAWLFSAVFWCALGALCFCLSAPGWIPDAIIRQRNESAQANRPRFSFAQASKSVQPPMCF
jgi:Na+/melibiose symporter-like transporter